MQLTPQQVTRVLQLQADFDKFTREIAVLEKMAAELVHDPFDIKISFDAHNKKQHEENKKVTEENQHTIEELPGGIIAQTIPGATFYFRGLLAHAFGIQNIPSSQAKECRTIINASCTESTGLRILDAILQEKREGRDLAQREIESILIPKLSIQIEPANPIHSLYENEAERNK